MYKITSSDQGQVIYINVDCIEVDFKAYYCVQLKIKKKILGQFIFQNF